MIAIAAFVLSALLVAVGGMFSDEMRGRLERAPRGLLRIAAMRLPASQREAIYNEEWLPELIFILSKAEGLPITRLIIGTRYAASMIRSAGRVARSLDPVRDHRPARSGPTAQNLRWILAGLTARKRWQDEAPLLVKTHEGLRAAALAVNGIYPKRGSAKTALEADKDAME